LSNWRVPTIAELATVFPATESPFVDSKYTPNRCCAPPHEYASYWTSELDLRMKDYAFVYHWYADGGANNCYASKNLVYVRCVHDPVRGCSGRPAAPGSSRAEQTEPTRMPTPAPKTLYLRHVLPVRVTHAQLEEVGAGRFQRDRSAAGNRKLSEIFRAQARPRAVVLHRDPNNIGLPFFSDELLRLKRDSRGYSGTITFDFYPKRDRQVASKTTRVPIRPSSGESHLKSDQGKINSGKNRYAIEIVSMGQSGRWGSVRYVPATGSAWLLRGDAWVPIAEPESAADRPQAGPFVIKLIHTEPGRFAALRMSGSTGRSWQLFDEQWRPIADE